MSLHHFFIVNNSGGLIYYLPWHTKSPLNGNDSLRIASTFHSLYEIASQLDPNKDEGDGQGTGDNNNNNNAIPSASMLSRSSSVGELISISGMKTNGMTELETATFSFRCFQSLTGAKFFATGDYAAAKETLDSYLKNVYELYAEWVMKDPFYELDMPIRVEKFESRLQSLTRERFGPPMGGAR